MVADMHVMRARDQIEEGQIEEMRDLFSRPYVLPRKRESRAAGVALEALGSCVRRST